MKIINKTILITGGGAGIGLALAEQLLANNNEVIICGRNEEKLKKAQQLFPKLHYITCDINNEQQLQEMLQRLDARGGIDVVINNAGVAHGSDLLHDKDMFSKAKDEFDTNFFAVIRLTQLLLPGLLKRAEAAVINVSSGLAYAPFVREATYSASKAALHSYTLSLRHLLKSSGVKVFELLPTFTETDLAKDMDKKKVNPSVVAAALIKGVAANNYEIRVKDVNLLNIINRISPATALRALNKG